MSSISWCVSACNEHAELDKLLNQLVTYIDSEDELILLIDESKVTSEVSQVISKYRAVYPTLKLIGANLGGDFSTFKNRFVETALRDFIVQIDADEFLSDSILMGQEPYGDLKAILDMNPQVDMYWIPRENYVEGITPEHIQRWGWRQDEKGRINFPDIQARIFKNNKQIKWVNKVHEVLNGYTQYATLPSNYFLIHKKDIIRQEQQNSFYNTL